MNIAVCDDEIILARELKLKINQYFSHMDVDVFSSVKALKNSNKEYDIIFLDIEMPEESGLDLAKEYREVNFQGEIVFLTSHMEYMQDAFKVRALRYLIKPVKDEDLKEIFYSLQKEEIKQHKVSVKCQNMYKQVLVSDIIFIQAKGNYSFIVTHNDRIESLQTLKQWVELLKDDGFVLVHRSYYISVQHIRMIDGEDLYMEGLEETIPVSRRKLSELKRTYLNYIDENAKFIG